MNHQSSQERWLKQYYALRAAFSVAWVIAAFTAGKFSWFVGAVLLVSYPAWDAVANFIDAARNGGLALNRSQAINFAVSLATTLAVALSLQSMQAVLGVFGAWAIVAGLLQLFTAVRRWKANGGQWAMILSGGQSALAGGAFIFQALHTPEPPALATVAGYAGVGAFYFLVSAVWLTVGARRRKNA
jgi:uncharacterized membrane protein HdeD (DUF308 family)